MIRDDVRSSSLLSRCSSSPPSKDTTTKPTTGSRAASRSESTSVPAFATETRLYHAEHLAILDRPDDDQRALTLVDECLSMFEPHRHHLTGRALELRHTLAAPHRRTPEELPIQGSTRPPVTRLVRTEDATSPITRSEHSIRGIPLVMW
jgi:hypothetical protein